MEQRHKRIAAALAAVSAFLEEESRRAATLPAAPPSSASLWAFAGRLDAIGSRLARTWKRGG